MDTELVTKTQTLVVLTRRQEETAVREIARIRRRDQVVTPKAVVEEARPATAPLHPVFEWDDAVAGERFREEQARWLIKSVRVTNNHGHDPTRTVRAFVPDDGEEDAADAYVMTGSDVVNRTRAEFLQALRDLQSRFGTFPDLAAFISELQTRAADLLRAGPTAIPAADAGDLFQIAKELLIGEGELSKVVLERRMRSRAPQVSDAAIVTVIGRLTTGGLAIVVPHHAGGTALRWVKTTRALEASHA